MANIHSFNALLEETIRKNWERNALTDYKGRTLQYGVVARRIEKLHIIFESAGIKPGDKIGICGRNSAMWACVFLATVSYGAVIVPIQNEFKPDQVYNIVNHSDSKLLFLGDVVAPTLDSEKMPGLEGVFFLPDCSLLTCRSEKLAYSREHIDELFEQKYGKDFTSDDVHYYEDQEEELLMINYTSGTTGFSKGVMLPYRVMWSNMDYLMEVLGSKIKPNSDVLAILPMAHMYGLSCEFLLNFCMGNHLYFLTRLPSPTIIQHAFTEIHPSMIVSVPLIIEKIIRKQIFPQLESKRMKMLLMIPGIKGKIKKRIYNQVMEVMGGNCYEILIGGASFSKEIEKFFTMIKFPITVGYGTTETGPMITYSDYTDFVPGSCGTAAKHMEVKILNPNPKTGAGEIVTRGLNVMHGYYKNEEATMEVIDQDGWFHTGDLGRMSKDGHLFILGRIKNMLLGSNGQNVYPEEIEDKLNSMLMVNESIVLQKGDKLVALVNPDLNDADNVGLNKEDIMRVMEQNRKELNAQLPSFCKISEIKLHDKEFEKTPKKSIKRYLYKNMI
ncbi:MAG: AMP-binding protein [Bacteroidaceae bacterium]|nr:AMP-binding protein [Bacteroidaceae bacterium]